MTHQGKAVIVTAPSGSGKTTIVKRLLREVPDLSFSVSATTRPMRKGEQHGEDYYFFSVSEFDQRLKAQEFIEWEEVYPGKRYGTLRKEIERLWAESKCVIFDVDVRGAVNLKEYFGANALALFIRVPTAEVLEERLRGRESESEASLKERLERSEYEMTFEEKFDVTVINDELERAVGEVIDRVRSFIRAE